MAQKSKFTREPCTDPSDPLWAQLWDDAWDCIEAYAENPDPEFPTWRVRRDVLADAAAEYDRLKSMADAEAYGPGPAVFDTMSGGSFSL